MLGFPYFLQKKLMSRSDNNNDPMSQAQWLQKLDEAMLVQTESQNASLRYVLRVQRYFEKMYVHLCLLVARPMAQQGRWTKGLLFNPQSPSHDALLDEGDREIYSLLQTIHDEVIVVDGANFLLCGRQASFILENVLNTHRAHWHELTDPVLSFSSPREAYLFWHVDSSGRQRLQCRVAGSNALILPLEPLHYVDVAQKALGVVTLPVEETVVAKMWNVPVADYGAKKLTVSDLDTIHLEKKSLTPQPYLRLFGVQSAIEQRSEEVMLGAAELGFIYGACLCWEEDPQNHRAYLQTEALVTFERDRLLERRFKQVLNDLLQYEKRVRPDKLSEAVEEVRRYYWLQDPDTDDIKPQLLHFILEVVPSLRSQGWRVDIHPSFPITEILEEGQWYSKAEDLAQKDWFSLEVGMRYGGDKQLNLLPFMESLLRQKKREGEDYFIHENIFYVRLDSNRYLPVPYGEVQKILELLVDLNDRSQFKDGRLHLPYLRALDVVAVSEAVESCEFTWATQERLQQLAHKLASFSGITRATPPKHFQTELRHYQLDGLSWLQFLREYGLAGVLADDMGLGKTVQTLAHLQLEKEAGRLEKPSLIVAPTTLAFNWRQEAQRFTPELKILMLHGDERRKHFTAASQADVLITTYPLLVRDQAWLKEQPFYFLILDEAQIVKNPRAKSTRVLTQLQSEHRLCLTGTPLENHLGELWSLFHFLMPGLLGDRAFFRKYFQIPIERAQNTARQKQLAKRIAPFLLRRTKDKVARELPAKTESIHWVMLDEKQRLLYESIRLAMEQKVSDLLKKQGAERSQILILDALLKLRQACCDPRLLKLRTEGQTLESAKLETLMTLLPNLIEEGRKVLVFSSFTSMLQLIEKEVQALQIPYEMLTGKTRNREAVVARFQSGEVPLFLISLKAGGIGLNLTAADTVIHYDPWWNPAAENQATDRAHRIGQDKPVLVYKLITADTVEERILELQKCKQSLTQNLLQASSFEASALNADDLAFLFQPIQPPKEG